MKKYLIIASATIFIIACKNRPGNITSPKDNIIADHFDFNQAKTEIKNEMAKFQSEIKKGDSVAMVTHFSLDAILMPPNSQNIEHDKISSFLGGAIRAGLKEMKVNTEDVIGNAGLLAETGTYELYGDNNTLMEKGKFILIWKSENGNWRIYRDIWNTSPPTKEEK